MGNVARAEGAWGLGQGGPWRLGTLLIFNLSWSDSVGGFLTGSGQALISMFRRSC